KDQFHIVVTLRQISARENIPSSVYITGRSVARTARSATSSTPMAMRNTAIERASIRNKSRRSEAEDFPASGFTVLTLSSVLRRRSGLEEGSFDWTGPGLFFTGLIRDWLRNCFVISASQKRFRSSHSCHIYNNHNGLQ